MIPIEDSSSKVSIFPKTYLGPLDDMLDISVAVRQVFTNSLGVAVEHAGLWWLAGLDGHGPGTVLDAGGDVVGAGVGVGGGEVHVEGAGRGVVGVEGVHACDFTGVGVHTAGGLAGLDVTPNYKCQYC